jgi:hypothetical protein
VFDGVYIGPDFPFYFAFVFRFSIAWCSAFIFLSLYEWVVGTVV